MLIDLHTHSSESDGTLSPDALIKLAKTTDIDTIALCDHDTTSGNLLFIESGKKNGIVAIPGIEISTQMESNEFHILGLNVPPECELLEKTLQTYSLARSERNNKIVAKLNEIGIPVSIEELRTYASGSIGRPHFAKFLMENGFAISINEAFERYLRKGAIAYVERFRFDVFEIISLLKNIGAIVVLAHPGLIKLKNDELENVIVKLIDSGLDGIEAYTPHHNTHQVMFFENLAKRYQVFCSGGSDFHGENKPGHNLGYYCGKDRIPESVRDIETLIKKQKQTNGMD